MSATETVDRKIEEAAVILLDALQALADGRLVDLGSVDEVVTALCRDVGSLAAPQAKDVAPRMAELIAALDRLDHGLRVRRAQLSGRATVEQAVRAYGDQQPIRDSEAAPPSASDPPGSDPPR
jgi:hypothetical protein